MVVLFALAAVACGSLVPLAQPPHHPAVVLDPHGRPLDTADVINARAVHLQAKALEYNAPLVHAAVAPVAYAAPIAHVAPAVYAAPAAVSHQSRVDVRTSPAIVSHAIASPILTHSVGLAGHGHWLKKRSLAHVAYSAPIVAPSAVSHQSRVDVISSPAVVSHAVAAPVVAHAVAAPVVALAPSAVSHQSRVDVRTSPAVVTQSVVSPYAHGLVAGPVAHGLVASPLAHGLVAGPLAHSGYVHGNPLVHGW